MGVAGVLLHMAGAIIAGFFAGVFAERQVGSKSHRASCRMPQGPVSGKMHSDSGQQICYGVGGPGSR
jgi:hypothetical protein